MKIEIHIDDTNMDPDTIRERVQDMVRNGEFAIEQTFAELCDLGDVRVYGTHVDRFGQTHTTDD
jgi:hypothetical protein